jgi:hypothetical protein
VNSSNRFFNEWSVENELEWRGRHVTSLQLHHPSRILRGSEVGVWDLRSIRLFITLPKTIRPSRFFSIPRIQKMISHGLSTSWYMALSTSINSYFKTVGRQIISSQVHSTNTSLKRLHQSRYFRIPWCRKWVHEAFRHLETSPQRLQQSWFLRRPEGRLWVLRAIRLLKQHLSAIVQIAFLNAKI